MGRRSYDIAIGRGLLKKSGILLKTLGIGNDAVVITNKTLHRLYGKILEDSFRRSSINIRFELVPDSEKAKSLKVLTPLICAISSFDVGRSVFIVSFGGGVIGDLAGFVASVYKRGVPYIQMPTTLLAQVDSSIGGKVAVDLPVAKNLAGAFYQPKMVISDASILKSLPKREITSGLAEIIKCGVIKDPRLFAYLEGNVGRVLRLEPAAVEYVVSRSSAIKARAVEKDELDKRRVRMILNFGHTVGHAIEAASGYGSRYNHGEAVAIGMIAASRMAVKLGMAEESVAGRIEDLIKKSGLPTTIKGLALIDIYGALRHDKKFEGAANRFVLPVDVGRVRIVENIPERVIKCAIKSCIKG